MKTKELTQVVQCSGCDLELGYAYKDDYPCMPLMCYDCMSNIEERDKPDS